MDVGEDMDESVAYQHVPSCHYRAEFLQVIVNFGLLQSKWAVGESGVLIDPSDIDLATLDGGDYLVVISLNFVD